MNSTRAAPGLRDFAEFKENWSLMLVSIIGCAMCMAAISTQSIGPFVKPIEAEMGWSRTSIQASLFFGQAISAIGVILTGMLLERGSSRLLGLVGMAGTGVGFVIVSMSDSLVLFYAGYGLAALIGSAAGPILWSRAIAARFNLRRGLALAIALSGTGVSGVILPPILTWTIAVHGWRIGYLVLAAFPLLIALPVIFLLFRPQAPVLSASASAATKPFASAPQVRVIEILSNYRFWIILVSVFCVYFGAVGILPNFISALTDAGVSPSQSAIAQATLAVSMIAGRLMVGYLSDRHWAPAVGALFLTPSAIGCYLLVVQPTFPIAILAAALIGAATGAELDLMAYLISRYFPPHLFARTYACLYAVIAAAGGTAPMAFAAIYDRTGSYSLSFAMSGIMFLIGGPCLLLLGAYLPHSVTAAPDTSSA